MKTLIQIVGSFIISFVVLCLEFNNRPLFYHLYPLMEKPLSYLQGGTSSALSQSWASGKNYAEKIFINSIPVSPDKKKSRGQTQSFPQPPQEEVSEDDKNQLNDLIKRH